ncbi:MAG: sodium-translocating pyrophosphatase, partial [Candidatus Rokubacteria bacterium]|nr:sodium-translocating pyrophosphatase [Candidatus Rokubacteria bacterium]
MNRTPEAHRRAVWVLPVLLALVLLVAMAGPALDAAWAQGAAAPAQHQGGGEANLKIPDLSQVSFGGMTGRTLLQWGLLVCLLGLGFGMVIFKQLRVLPVHQSMREISELIYET